MSRIPPLTPDQIRVKNEILNFILDPNSKYLNFISPAGCGKTTLLSWFVQLGYGVKEINECANMFGTELPFNRLMLSALTNKAANEILIKSGYDCKTVHSIFGLRVQNNVHTGKVELVSSPNSPVLQNIILFVDEASMVDKVLFKHIDEHTYQCKVIFVGDDCQLPPVGSSFSVFKQNFPEVRLTKQVRFNNKKGITALTEQLRQTVYTGTFKPLFTFPNEIEHYMHKDAEPVIKNIFSSGSRNVLLGYTNNRVEQFGEYINYDVHGYSAAIEPGREYIVVDTVINRDFRSIILRTEEHILLKDSYVPVQTYGLAEDAKFTYRKFLVKSLDIVTGLDKEDTKVVKVVLDTTGFTKCLKYLSKTKNWKEYFYLKETFCVLRNPEVCTVHKSQGSTYDTVVVDLQDIGKCTSYNTAARLLYVACSRARSKLVLLGNLPGRLGGRVIDGQHLIM